VILAVNYMADTFQKHVGNEKYGMKITYSREPKPLGTGGPVKYLEKTLRDNRDEEFLILNGDIFSDVDYQALKKSHDQHSKQNRAILTITLYEIREPGRFGVVQVDRSSKVLKFVEKPKEVKGRSLINTGVYVANLDILRYLKEGRCSIEREVFPILAEENRMYAYRHRGMWVDIGKPRDYAVANFKTMDSIAKNKPRIGENVEKGRGSKIISPSLVGDGVQIGKEAIIGPYTAIGNNVILGEQCKVERSIIFDKAVIGSNCSIKNAIVGEASNLGQRVRVGERCIIGDQVTIFNSVKLTKGVSICPFKEVEEDITRPGHVV
jgi:mannose-1-phosphate guanylyltransferase